MENQVTAALEFIASEITRINNKMDYDFNGELSHIDTAVYRYAIGKLLEVKQVLENK